MGNISICISILHIHRESVKPHVKTLTTLSTGPSGANLSEIWYDNGWGNPPLVAWPGNYQGPLLLMRVNVNPSMDK